MQGIIFFNLASEFLLLSFMIVIAFCKENEMKQKLTFYVGVILLSFNLKLINEFFSVDHKSHLACTNAKATPQSDS